MAKFEDQVKNEYFKWLYNYGCKSKTNNKISYHKLFVLLYDTTFDFYHYSDLNRAMDGTDLRYRFAYTVKYDTSIVMDILDKPCSVLEMILALAIKCEETIMDNPKYGDRTLQWFWSMLKNLGLAYMTDERFDEKIANDILYNFMERRYEPNGKGGLFYIPNYDGDLTQLDIWSQLGIYLDDFD